MKIVFTGGNGRFGKIFRSNSKLKNIEFPTKRQFNILNLSSIKKYLIKKKVKILIHAAGLSRPMSVHEKKMGLSIDTNIIGTCNLVKVCKKLNIKLVYFSTSYVYPGKRGNYKEIDPLLPINNYAWSKLGGEASVQLYKNSLILRTSMQEKPFKSNCESSGYTIETLKDVLSGVVDVTGSNDKGKPMFLHFMGHGEETTGPSFMKEKNGKYETVSVIESEQENAGTYFLQEGHR